MRLIDHRLRNALRKRNESTGAAMQTLDSVLVQPHPQAQRAHLQRAALQCRAAFSRVTNQCIDLLLTWQRRAAERAILAAMSERELRDIGLARGDVLVEADKPFWRA